MKPKYIIIILSALAYICACAPKPVITPEPFPPEKEDELFANAEKLFETQSYAEALDLYERYFERFPNEPLAPAALMKIGIIHALSGDYEEARGAYRQIISQYPSSPFTPDAAFEELFTYYQEGKFQEVLNRASYVLDRIDSRSHVFRVYALLGDTFMAMGSPIDAIEYYARAQQMATELEQEAITDKLKEAIAQLDSADVAILLNRPDTTLPMDYLLFQLGLNYAMEEKYDAALKILSEFIETYPQHKNRMLVESLIGEIKKNAVFNHYTVGCLLPLSGPYQTFGQRALKGIELALEQFSARGGNPPINIIVKDTAADANKTIVALEELYHDQVAVILGPIVTAEVAAQESQKMGIPIITITQKDKIPEIGDKVFRNFITPQMQVQALASYAVGALGLRRFAILYPDENYGNTFMNLFWDQLLEMGAKVVGVESYSPKQTDFADPIKKLVGLYYKIPEDLKPQKDLNPSGEDNEISAQKGDNTQENAERAVKEEEEPEPIIDFDAIFIPDSPNKAGLIVPQLIYYDVKDVYLLGTNLWHSDALIKIADQYVQGAILPDGFFAESSSPQVKNFIKNFEETYQEKPDFIEAVVYDSAMILFHVISQPHIRFRSDIRDALLNPEGFPGVTGLTRFDETGEVQRKLHLLRIKGTQFVELE